MSPQALTPYAATSPPEGSKIRVSRTARGLLLLLTTPPPLSVDRIKQATVIGVWLLCWTAVELFTLAVLLFAKHDTRFYLIPWLCIWTLCGAPMWMVFLNLVRGPLPERIFLTELHLRHEPSTARTWARLLPQALRTAADTQVRRPQLASLRLDHKRGRQRLLFDHGKHQVEIGKYLADPERAWLADVISQWVKDRGYR